MQHQCLSIKGGGLKAVILQVAEKHVIQREGEE
jgi:hypothetical protein